MFPHEDRLFQEDLYGHKCHISGTTVNNFSSSEFQRQVIKLVDPKMIVLGGLNDSAIRRSEVSKSVLPSKKLLHRPEQMFCKERMIDYLQRRLERDQYFLFNEKKRLFLIASERERRIVANEYFSAAYETAFMDGCKLAFGKPSDLLIFQDLMLRLPLEELRCAFDRCIQKVVSRHRGDIKFRITRVMQALRIYAMSDQPALFSKQITYTTALLNRYAKIQPKILLLVPGFYAKRVAESVHHIHVNPQDIYRGWTNDSQSESAVMLSNILGNPESIDQLLQKFAILCILKQNYLQEQLVKGNNIFLDTIFQPLFRDLPEEELYGRYGQLKGKYASRIRDVQRLRLENILGRQAKSRLMRLQDQLIVVSKRSSSFPYSFQAKNHITVRQDSVKIDQLHSKMKEILEEEDNQSDIALFESFCKGQVSKEGIILYSKLIGKANVQLDDRVKLPLYHYGAFRGIYKEYLRDYLLRPEQQSPKLEKKLDQLQQKIMKAGKEVSDPEMIRKYLTGEMGKFKCVNLYQDDSMDDNLEEQVKNLDEVILQMEKTGIISKQDEKE